MPPEYEIIVRLAITVVFGAILGLESETRFTAGKEKHELPKIKKQKIGGVRTYTILSLIGGIAGLFYLEKVYILTYILFTIICLITLAAYIMNVQYKKSFGITTEIAIIITTALGFIVTAKIVPIGIAIIILIILTFFLSQKRGVASFVEKINHQEVIDLIKFGLVALVIFPLLPNIDLKLNDILPLTGMNVEVADNLKDIIIINPAKTWLIVVLISGFSLLGYMTSKFIGVSRGILVTGFIGGLVSSTAASISLGSKTKDLKDKAVTQLYAGSALISNATSFIHISILVLVSSTIFFYKILPVVLIMTIVGLIVGFVLIYLQKNTKVNSSLKIEYQPFSIVPAIEFVLVITTVKILVQIFQSADLQGFSLLITSISSLVGMDASAISIADLVQANKISLDEGLIAFAVANVINFIAKSFYTYISANKSFWIKFSIGLLITACFGLIPVLLDVFF